MTRERLICGVMLLLAVLCGCQRSPEVLRDRFLSSGKQFLQKQDYARAILDFKNAARAMPKDAEPYYELGVASEASGDLRTAVASFRKALSLNPNHAGAQLKLAQLMTISNNQGYLKDAETRLSALKQSEPASLEVLDSLALAQLKLGETDKAVENLQQAVANAPGELRSSILLAQTKLAQHDTNGAEAVLKNACEAAPKSAQARVVLGELYLSEQKIPEAEAEFQRALAIDPKSGEALLQLGNVYNSTGRKQEAEQTFQRLANSGELRYKPVHAQFLFQEGRQDEAVREFEALAKQNPSDRVARTRLIAAYQVVKRNVDAQKILDEVLKKDPKDLDALLQRSEIFVRTNKFAQAEADLNQVLHLQPDSAEAHYIRAQLDRTRGENLTYRQELSEVLRLNPDLLPVRLELGNSLMQDGQAQAALETLNAAPVPQRELPAVIVERNWAFWSMGDLASMRKGIDQGLSQVRSTDLLLQDGLWKLRNGDYSAARASLEEALKINPADVRALRGLDVSYVIQKQAAAGIEKVKEYASRQPQSAPVQEFLGTALLSQGNRDQAEAAFTAAKKADPHFEDADLSLTQIDLLNGKVDSAQKKLEAILASDPDNKVAHMWLANIETMKGNYSTAAERYRQVMAESPNNAQALNNLAYILAEYSHQPDQALAYAQRAVELAPDRPEYRDTLGWVLYRKALYTSAITELESAASKGDNARWHYHLAMAYIKAGDLKRGRATFQDALKRNPNLPEAKAAEEMLAQRK
jgi:tetratricopeptide (TPR) repeat protein